jgi:hypothetical protein
VQIRPATLLDVSAIVCMLNDMHASHKTTEPNWFKITHTVVENIRTGVVILAITDEGELMGSIGGRAAAEWYSDVPHLGDHWFYVRKEHRQSPAAFRLVKDFRKAGQTMQVPVKLAHVLNESVDRMDKFYGKLGFERSGTLFTEKYDG